MRILFLGDIVARLGRETTGKVLPSIRKSANIALVLANAENIAHGKGATRATLKELTDYGVDFFTSGNHIWWQKDSYGDLDDSSLPIIRPANYSNDVPGRGWEIIDTGKTGKVLVINLLGRTLINQPVDCPFKVVDEILDKNKRKKLSATIVDMHAELTSERMAMGWYLDGRVSAVVGTHTHVPTADAWMMPKGTAYISDVGMVGAKHSVIGVQPEIIVDLLKYPKPQRFEWVDQGPAVFNSVVIEIDRKTGNATTIKRIDKIIS